MLLQHLGGESTNTRESLKKRMIEDDKIVGSIPKKDRESFIDYMMQQVDIVR